MTPEVSVVVPCFNEAANLEPITERFRAVAARAALELILVDNGSTDGTPEILGSLLARPENSFARALRVEINRGYGDGLRKGLAAASAPIVAFTHADLQCPPEDILRARDIFLEESARGPCLVMGRRCGPRPAAERFVSWGFSLLAAWRLGLRSTEAGPGAGNRRAPDINAQPKLFGRELIGRLAAGPRDFTFDLFVLHAAAAEGRKIVEFPVRYLPRDWGESKLAAGARARLRNAAAAWRLMARLRRGGF